MGSRQSTRRLEAGRIFSRGGTGERVSARRRRMSLADGASEASSGSGSLAGHADGDRAKNRHGTPAEKRGAAGLDGAEINGLAPALTDSALGTKMEFPAWPGALIEAKP